MDSISIAFSQELAQEYINSNDLFPVDFDNAWQWLGYSTKQKAKTKLENNFDKDLDYNVNQTVKVQNEGGRTVSRPYDAIFLTIDCFKSLAMMAGTSQGKQVRLYFLECEKIAKSAIAHSMPQTYGEALLEAGRLAIECEKLEKEKAILNNKITQDAPLVRYAESVKYSDSSIEFHEFAKLIKNHGGRNTVMQKLREVNILMKTSTLPYQKYIDAGYFEVGQEIDRENGRLLPFALVTGKGQIWLHQKLIAYDESNQQLSLFQQN
jgi:anti-repressor protein